MKTEKSAYHEEIDTQFQEPENASTVKKIYHINDKFYHLFSNNMISALDFKNESNGSKIKDELYGFLRKKNVM